ncbi:MAG: DUF2752 domain-containing protein [Clostridia bacterium]|nr:DUF2752 domain-containing protein [Clostridia bacterium]
MKHFLVSIKNRLITFIYKAAFKAFRHFKIIAVPFAYIAVFYFVVVIVGNDTVCVIKNIYGIPCPACGMTRAFVHLSQGHISEALYYHPLFVIPVITSVVLAFKKFKYFSLLYKNDSFWYALTALLVAVWIIRMIALFPDNEPMDFKSSAFIPRLYSYFFGK